MKPDPSSSAAEALRAKRGEIAEHIKSLKTDVTKRRSRIGELRKRRDEIVDAHVSKEEYIRLSLEWVDFLADNAAQRMARGFSDRHTGVTSAGREGLTKVGRFLSQGRAPANPLSHIIGTDQHNRATIEPLYLVLFLREPIKEALRTHVLGYVDWPFDKANTDVEAARKEVAAIDAELEILEGELSELVALGESFGATV